MKILFDETMHIRVLRTAICTELDRLDAFGVRYSRRAAFYVPTVDEKGEKVVFYDLMGKPMEVWPVDCRLYSCAAENNGL